MTNKTYVVRCSMKDARNYFAGQMVLQGRYNGKAAVYVSASYSTDDMDRTIQVFSAVPSNRYLGTFDATALVDISEAKGIVLVAK